ncbi:MAG: LacI family transcriptional regulator [Humibacillus sp.]|nr:LacI family transcriptional regulator [Humibacillus sp.]
MPATIYSVAERAGVSIATVSRVLQGSSVVSPAARQKVLDAVETLRYVPHAAARSLAVRHHEAFGLVLPELSGPYFAEMLMGFETRSAELGRSVTLLLADGKDDLPRAVAALAARVDALAVLGASALPLDLARTLAGRTPVVVIAGAPGAGAAELPGVERVGAENHCSATELTTHVLDHGRSRLLFVGDPDIAPDIRDRHAGFVAAHASRGMAAADPVRVPFRERDGEIVADQYLAGALEADGFVCANDELALALLTRLQDAGVVVPDDVAVVGWDDVMASRYVRPGLTTVRQPVHELGALAAHRLHERVAGETPPGPPHVLPTQIVVRGSCGCTSA